MIRVKGQKTNDKVKLMRKALKNHRLRMLYPLLALPADLDLLCYTPEELERMQDRPFIKHLRREEVVLYETNAS